MFVTEAPAVLSSLDITDASLSSFADGSCATFIVISSHRAFPSRNLESPGCAVCQPFTHGTSGVNGRFVLVSFEGISPASSESATIPPPSIPPPNQATYWHRSSKYPAPRCRLRDTSEAQKKKEKQALAETSTEKSPPPVLIAKRTSTVLILAITPLRAAELLQEAEKIYDSKDESGNDVGFRDM